MNEPTNEWMTEQKNQSLILYNNCIFCQIDPVQDLARGDWVTSFSLSSVNLYLKVQNTDDSNKCYTTNWLLNRSIYNQNLEIYNFEI